MTDLKQSYAWCRRVCRHSKSSFYASFALLDPPRRNAMCALYAFSRISDDLSDSSRPIRQRKVEFQQWQQQLDRLETLAGTQACVLPAYAPLWPALVDSISRFGIPICLLRDIVHGVSMDLQPRQPKDWSELRDYCYYVASSVGLACAHIWRASEEIPKERAIDCGIAFQLTNILRDVFEDAKQNRIYLPETLFAKHGVCPADWLAGNPGGNWQSMICETATEAKLMYHSGWQTIHELTPCSQRMFSLMWRSYRSLLNDVVDQPDRLWQTRKVRLSTMRKAVLLSTHFVGPLYASLSEPCLETS